MSTGREATTSPVSEGEITDDDDDPYTPSSEMFKHELLPDDVDDISNDGVSDSDSVVVLPPPVKAGPPVVTISDNESISSDETDALDVVDDLEILELRRNVLEATLTRQNTGIGVEPGILQQDNYDSTYMDVSPCNSEEHFSEEEIELPPASPTTVMPLPISATAITDQGSEITKEAERLDTAAEPPPADPIKPVEPQKSFGIVPPPPPAIRLGKDFSLSPRSSSHYSSPEPSARPLSSKARQQKNTKAKSPPTTVPKTQTVKLVGEIRPIHEYERNRSRHSSRTETNRSGYSRHESDDRRSQKRRASPFLRERNRSNSRSPSRRRRRIHSPPKYSPKYTRSRARILHDKDSSSSSRNSRSHEAEWDRMYEKSKLPKTYEPRDLATTFVVEQIPNSNYQQNQATPSFDPGPSFPHLGASHVPIQRVSIIPPQSMPESLSISTRHVQPQSSSMISPRSVSQTVTCTTGPSGSSNETPTPKVTLVNSPSFQHYEDEDQLRAKLLIELSKTRLAAERESFKDVAENLVVNISQDTRENPSTRRVSTTGSVYKWKRQNGVTSPLSKPAFSSPTTSNAARPSSSTNRFPNIQRTIYNQLAFQSKSPPDFRNMRYTVANKLATRRKRIRPIIINVRGETSSDESDVVTPNRNRTVRFGTKESSRSHASSNQHSSHSTPRFTSRNNSRRHSQENLSDNQRSKVSSSQRSVTEVPIPASVSSHIDNFIEHTRKSVAARFNRRNLRESRQGRNEAKSAHTNNSSNEEHFQNNHADSMEVSSTAQMKFTNSKGGNAKGPENRHVRRRQVVETDLFNPNEVERHELSTRFVTNEISSLSNKPSPKSFQRPSPGKRVVRTSHSEGNRDSLEVNKLSKQNHSQRDVVTPNSETNGPLTTAAARDREGSHETESGSKHKANNAKDKQPEDEIDLHRQELESPQVDSTETTKIQTNYSETEARGAQELNHVELESKSETEDLSVESGGNVETGVPEVNTEVEFDLSKVKKEVENVPTDADTAETTKSPEASADVEIGHLEVKKEVETAELEPDVVFRTEQAAPIVELHFGEVEVKKETETHHADANTISTPGAEQPETTMEARRFDQVEVKKEVENVEADSDSVVTAGQVKRMTEPLDGHVEVKREVNTLEDDSGRVVTAEPVKPATELDAIVCVTVKKEVEDTHADSDINLTTGQLESVSNTEIDSKPEVLLLYPTTTPESVQTNQVKVKTEVEGDETEAKPDIQILLVHWREGPETEQVQPKIEVEEEPVETNADTEHEDTFGGQAGVGTAMEVDMLDVTQIKQEPISDEECMCPSAAETGVEDIGFHIQFGARNATPDTDFEWDVIEVLPVPEQEEQLGANESIDSTTAADTTDERFGDALAEPDGDTVNESTEMANGGEEHVQQQPAKDSTTINLIFQSLEGTVQEKRHKELLLRERLLKAALRRKMETSELQLNLRNAERKLVNKRKQCLTKVDALNVRLKKLSAAKFQKRKLTDLRIYYARQLANVERQLTGNKKKIEKLETIVRSRTATFLKEQSQYVKMTESCIEYGGKLSGIRYLLPNSSMAEYDRKYAEAQKAIEKLGMNITLPENAKVPVGPSTSPKVRKPKELNLRPNQRVRFTGITKHSYVETDDELDETNLEDGRFRVPFHELKGCLKTIEVQIPQRFEPYVSLVTIETKKALGLTGDSTHELRSNLENGQMNEPERRKTPVKSLYDGNAATNEGVTAAADAE